MAHPYARWTPAEVATLREHIHTVSLDRLAWLCGHTPGATRRKVYRLSLHYAVIGDTYTSRDLEQCFRVSNQTIRRWIEAGWLRGEKPGKDWRITPAALRAFILARPLEVASGHVDVAWLLAIISPEVKRQQRGTLKADDPTPGGTPAPTHARCYSVSPP
jgi:excisionase family DNA binding protein